MPEKKSKLKSSSGAEAKSGNSDADAPVLDTGLQRHLGTKLRLVYGEISSEPIPDRFLKLLDELARSESTEAQEKSKGS